MQRVAQQRHRTRQDNHAGLQRCGQRQDDEADPQRPAATGIGFERGIDLVGGIVRMAAQQLIDCVSDRRPPTVRLIGVMIMKMPVTATPALVVIVDQPVAGVSMGHPVAFAGR